MSAGMEGGASFRMPPVNREAELGVIAASVYESAVADECIRLLEPEDFFDERCADAFRAIRAMRERAVPIDWLTISEEIRRSGSRWAATDNLPSDAYNDFAAEAAGSIATTNHAAYHAAIVKDKATKRRLIAACSEILAECYDERDVVESILDRAEDRIFKVGDSWDAKATATIAEAIDGAFDRMERRRRGEFIGVTTGFQRLDELCDGLGNGKMAIIAARPSIGKSAFALNIAEHVASCGRAVLYVSLEMKKEELAERFLAGRGSVDGYRIRTASGLSPEDQRNLARVRTEAQNFRLYVDDNSERTYGQIAAEARRLKARNCLDLLIIDYLQLVDAKQERGESREQVVSKLSRRFKKLAGNLDVPVVVLAQLNRQPEGREDKRPRLSDLRESGSIEQDPDLVILLHRPDFYDPNDHPGEAEIIVAKQRAGPTGSIRLKYTRCFVRFDEEERYDAYGNSI